MLALGKMVHNFQQLFLKPWLTWNKQLWQLKAVFLLIMVVFIMVDFYCLIRYASRIYVSYAIRMAYACYRCFGSVYSSHLCNISMWKRAISTSVCVLNMPLKIHVFPFFSSYTAFLLPSLSVRNLFFSCQIWISQCYLETIETDNTISLNVFKLKSLILHFI